MDIQQSSSQQADLRQEQTLTHRQIQALEMLAAPLQNLQTMIRTELERNPILEIDGETEFAPLLPEEQPVANPDRDESVAIEEWLAIQDACPDDDGGFNSSPDDQRRREHYFESIAVQSSTQEDLLAQIRFLNLDASVCECCEWIISGLNDDGYLAAHLADLAMASSLAVEKLEEALRFVQNCEPAGIAARSLQERLLLQLERRGRQDSLACRVVREHLAEVAANKLPAVARKLHVPLSDLYHALSEIRALQPHLAQGGPPSAMEYVEEEAVVVEKGGRLDVVVPHERLPSLRISEAYREMLENPETPPETRDFIRKKIGAAINFINNISQRQSTLQRIIACVVDLQADFFLHGPAHIKPLIMAQVAQRLGVHETTVSRAVNGKFLRCRQGLYPLRHFFTTALVDEEGHEVSNAVIKDAIRELIVDEDSAAPLSDSDIAGLLKKRNLRVARRTVAKYREALNVPPSYLRRQFA